MVATIQLSQEQKALMEREVSPIVQRAKDLEIRTADDSQRAQVSIQDIKRRAKAIHEKFDPPVRAAHAAWKASKDLYNFFMTPFQDAEALIKRKVVTFEADQERKRQVEARKAEAKRLEEERRQREVKEAQARKAAAAGKIEKADALMEEAEAVVVAPVFVPPDPEMVKGTVLRETWKAEVTDMSLLCEAIGKRNGVPANFVLPNPTALSAYARAVKDTVEVPGVRFFKETNLSVRA